MLVVFLVIIFYLNNQFLGVSGLGIKVAIVDCRRSIAVDSILTTSPTFQLFQIHLNRLEHKAVISTSITHRIHRWIIGIPMGAVFRPISTPDSTPDSMFDFLVCGFIAAFVAMIAATTHSRPIRPFEVLLFSSSKSSFLIIRNKLSKNKNT